MKNSNKVVYNSCFGGFGLSRKALDRLIELGSEEAKLTLDECDKYCTHYGSYDPRMFRHDLKLVQVVEELGKEANGKYASLKIYKLEGDRYRIKDFDGKEEVIDIYSNYVDVYLDCYCVHDGESYNR